jgi:aspartate kinase
MTESVVHGRKTGIIVQKYGGSSVANIEMLKRVAGKIVETREEGHGVVVVISAMGNQTDELLNLAKQISARPSSRELDMLLSVGERIAMAILSMAINDLGYRAISFTGSQSGIITDTSHTRARIVEVRAERIIEELGRGKIVIVAGYQGVSRDREITTLGRGGSDTTSIALAAALGAERCEIYSDVDGIYTADPRMVEDAIRLDQISYDELLDLSKSGAVVMKSEAVEFARKHNIRISLKSTFRKGKGTTVSRESSQAVRPVIGLSFDLSLILLWSPEARWSSRIRSDVIPCLTDLGFAPICIHRVSRGNDRQSHLFMAFREEGVTGPTEAIERIVAEHPRLLDHVQSCGSVTVITRDVHPFSRAHGLAVDILRREGYDLIGYNSTDRCCSLFLPVGDVLPALKLLHRELVPA